jgi:hypothetical protein
MYMVGCGSVRTKGTSASILTLFQLDTYCKEIRKRLKMQRRHLKRKKTRRQ